MRPAALLLASLVRRTPVRLRARSALPCRNASGRSCDRAARSVVTAAAARPFYQDEKSARDCARAARSVQSCPGERINLHWTGEPIGFQPAEEVMNHVWNRMTELLVILAIVLVIFGANKLPRSQGDGAGDRQFQEIHEGSNEIDDAEKKKIEGEEKKS